MERKLASIQKVVELNPIEGADKIEVCTVLGWKCVVKKGEFKPNELGVYFEVDSILPIDKPEFAFMDKHRGRVKTVRLRKQISQGLFFPLSAITYADLTNLNEGDDVTELLGIKKWEPQEFEHGANLGGRHRNFPKFLRKTDEIRIQAMPKFLERHNGKLFYIAEKVDGSSCSLYFLKDEMYDKPANTFGVCSRNLECDRPEPDGSINAFWKFVIDNNIEEKMRNLNMNICVQGELAGPGIQKNKYKLDKLEMFLFNAYDLVTQKYLSKKHLTDFAKALNMKTVPIVDEIVLNHTVDELVQMSIAKSVLNDSTYREGIVCRPINEDSDIDIDRASFKVINPEFLLQWNL